MYSETARPIDLNRQAEAHLGHSARDAPQDAAELVRIVTQVELLQAAVATHCSAELLQPARAQLPCYSNAGGQQGLWQQAGVLCFGVCIRDGQVKQSAEQRSAE